MSLLDDVLKVAADTALVHEKVSDEVAQWRMSVCTGCENFKAKPKKCGVCGCYMEVKTKAKTNFNPNKMRNEITHCPKGFWDDALLAAQYSQTDGFPVAN
jgi:hypothetical protein